MKLGFKTLFIVGVAGLLSACDSTTDRNGDPLIGMDYGGVIIKDAKKIKKIVETDSEGITMTTTYTYDKDDLATVVAKSTDGDEATYTLSYTDGVLDKVTVDEIKDAEPLTTVFNLLYVSGGKQLLSANGTATSSGTEIHTVTTNYNYSGSKVSKVSTVYNTSAMEIGRVDTNIGYSGDNVSTFDISTSMFGTAPIIVNSELSGYDDSRKNPYAAFPDAFKAFSINYMLGSAPMVVMSKSVNKYLKVNAMGQTIGINSVYKYGGDGYPISGSNDQGGKITFEYY